MAPWTQARVEWPRISLTQRWRRAGMVLAGADQWGTVVMGDPCIVRDEDARAWRMFLFALPPGHGQALCTGDPCEPGAWTFAGPLVFTNPEAMIGGAVFKPFVVLDSRLPARAARIEGRFALLVVADHRAKIVQRAWADTLAGPWTLEHSALIVRGAAGEADERHVDAVTAYYFADRDEILYYYMGYPTAPQLHELSPYGSSLCAAVETVGEQIPRDPRTEKSVAAVPNAQSRASSPSSRVRKLGTILRPASRQGHWAAGWVGGLQLLRGAEHQWIGVINASPTAPDPSDQSIAREEPAPSLGGFAFCDEDYPTRGWQWCDEPFEWVEQIPLEAQVSGETTNLWRHHALATDDGRLALFYNSGRYFEEKLFMKLSVQR